LRYRKLTGFNQPPIPPTIEGYGTGPYDILPFDQSVTTGGTPGEGIAGDYSFGHNAQDFFVNEPAAVAQAVLTALLLHQGEWFLDVTIGMPWETQVEGFNTQSLYDTAIKTVVLGVQGVLAILEYSSVLNPDTRSLSVNMILSTIFGTAVVGVTI
jgi:hypothetical protein